MSDCVRVGRRYLISAKLGIACFLPVAGNVMRVGGQPRIS